MAAKFFIWDGSRWREVSLDGRVDGWGSVDFVSVRGGKLEVARRADVLRGMRDLLAGKPSTVREGAPLRSIRIDDLKKKQQDEEIYHREHHYSIGALSLPQNEIFNRMLKSTASVGVQCGGTLDAATQAGNSALRDVHGRFKAQPKKQIKERTKKNEAERKPTKRKRSKSPGRRFDYNIETEEEGPECKELVIQEEDIELLRRFIERDDGKLFKVDLLKFDEDDDYKRQMFYKLNPIVVLARSRRIERMLREGRSRTTELSLKDFVTMLGLQSTAERQEKTRRTSKRNRKSVLSSPTVFTDDTDKENAVVAKPNQVKRMKVLKENDIAVRNVDTKDKKTEYVNKKVSKSAVASVVNSENRAIHVRGNDKGSKKDSGGKKDSDNKKESDSKKDSNSKKDSETNKVVPAKKIAAVTRRGKTREYSRLEDEAVLRLVSGGDRARLVNGNRLWRELQPLHHELTGQFRSWHSLRNRYLRYLLPHLAAHRSPQTAARLRAAAATGELKARKFPPRRNSVFKEARVLSAWGRRPRSPLRSSSSPSLKPPSPKPSTSRTPEPRSPRKPPVPHLSPYTPRRHTSTESSNLSQTTSSSSSESGSSWNRRRRSRSSVRRTPGTRVRRLLRSSSAGGARTGRARNVTPTYSDVTRRFATRPSPPSRPSRPSPSAADTPPVRRTRRLYNPQDAL